MTRGATSRRECYIPEKTRKGGRREDGRHRERGPSCVLSRLYQEAKGWDFQACPIDRDSGDGKGGGKLRRTNIVWVRLATYYLSR